MSDNQFRSAIRSLTRHKGYTAINILGLTLGLCACMVIYNVVSYEFSFDRIYPDRDRIYRVGARIREDHGNGTISEGYGRQIPAPVPGAIQKEVPSVATIAPFYPYRADISIPSTNRKIAAPNTGGAILTTPDYFGILPYVWLAGNPAQSLTQAYSVVLTETRAREYFGDLPAGQYLGKALIYDDSLNTRVAGIIKDYPGNTDFPFTDFISMATISHSYLKNTYRNDTWHFNPKIPGVNVFVRLAPHARPQRDEALINDILQRHIGDDAFLKLLNYSLVLQPLSDIHFDERYDFDGIRKAHKPALYGLIGAAVFILLLAIVNFVNLSTAQALQRAKDVSIRRILGASRLRLVNRSLTETAMLTSLAGIIALALVRPVLNLFHDYIPEGLPFNPFGPAILGFTLAIIAGTTLLAGLYPAVNSTSPRPSQKFTIRRVLIVFQFTISLLFIMASLAVGRQLGYMLDADMGFNSSAILTINNFSAQPQQLGSFAQQALHIPGVEQYTLQNNPPAGMHGMEFPMKADNQTSSMEVSLQTADQRFIPLYHMRLLAGRNISAGDSLREFLINDTYRKALGFARPDDALGHFLTWQNKTRPIVGVVADFHNSSLHTPIPAIALANISDFDHSVGLRITLGDPHTLPQLASLWKETFPDHPFSYSFLDESIAGLYKSDRQMSWMVRVSTAVTIFVSCIGLLGLILFTVERKKKEISIRKVLGAGVGDIVFLLNKEFMILVGIALAIASPIAFLGMRRWLQDFAYRVSISWWIFVLAGLITLAISLLTISLRVIRAALINPTENLRSE